MLRLFSTLWTVSQVATIWLFCLAMALGQQDSDDEVTFKKEVQPLLKEFCWKCHNAEIMKSDVRLDILTAKPEASHLKVWNAVAKQVGDEAMPPEDQPKPTAEQRKILADWASRMVAMAQSRLVPNYSSLRQWTVVRDRNLLSDLLRLTFSRLQIEALCGLIWMRVSAHTLVAKTLPLLRE